MDKKIGIILLLIVLLLIFWTCNRDKQKTGSDKPLPEEITVTCKDDPSQIDAELNRAVDSAPANTTIRIQNDCHIDRSLRISKKGIRITGAVKQSSDPVGYQKAARILTPASDANAIVPDSPDRRPRILGTRHNVPIVESNAAEFEINGVILEGGKFGLVVTPEGDANVKNVKIIDSKSDGICIIGVGINAGDYRKLAEPVEPTECERLAGKFRAKKSSGAGFSFFSNAHAAGHCPINLSNVYSGNTQGSGLVVVERCMTLSGGTLRFLGNKRGLVGADSATVRLSANRLIVQNNTQVGILMKDAKFLAVNNSWIAIGNNGTGSSNSLGGFYGFKAGSFILRPRSRVSMIAGSPNNPFDISLLDTSSFNCEESDWTNWFNTRPTMSTGTTIGCPLP